MFLHHANRLFNIARIAAEQQGLQILHGADHASGLPFECRFAPAEQAGLIGLYAHEHPVAHLGVHYVCFDSGYSQDRFRPQ